MKIYIYSRRLNMHFAAILMLAAVFTLSQISRASAVSSSEANFVFLNCKASRHYIGSDRRTVSEDIFLKIDTRNAEIHIFNADNNSYENRCSRIRSRPNQTTIGDTQSVCRIRGDMFSVSHSRILLGATIWETYYIHRGSGRMEGSVRLYAGAPTLNIAELAPRSAYIQYDINGACQRGQDMRNIRKGF